MSKWSGGWWDFPPEVDTVVKDAKAAGLTVVTCVIRQGVPGTLQGIALHYAQAQVDMYSVFSYISTCHVCMACLQGAAVRSVSAAIARAARAATLAVQIVLPF